MTIFDSDRFLRKTFSYAYEVSKPDAVIFVGDLFDEGATASESQILEYVTRFESIFGTNTRTGSEFLAYWGDNDISKSDFPSKENYESCRQKVGTMAKYLDGALDLAECRYLVGGKLLFYHYDPILEPDPNKEGICKSSNDFLVDINKFHMFKNSDIGKSHVKLGSTVEPIRIMISHYPFFGRHMSSMLFWKQNNNTIKNFQPHFMLAGHSHLGSVSWCYGCHSANQLQLQDTYR